MKAFLVACVAAVVIAVIGVVALSRVQEPVDEAFDFAVRRRCQSSQPTSAA